MVPGWVFTVPECFFKAFQGSRLGFHGLRWVFLVTLGSRVVFHGSRWVLWFFKVLGWCALQVDEEGVLVEGRLVGEILVILDLTSRLSGGVRATWTHVRS